jgi:hypothetical protein
MKRREILPIIPINRTETILLDRIAQDLLNYFKPVFRSSVTVQRSIPRLVKLSSTPALQVASFQTG